MKPEAAVFLDTPMFLHYISPDQIDWLAFTGAKVVHLLLAPVTTSELNDEKDSGNTQSIKDRARNALKLLERALDSEGPLQLRPNVFLSIVPKSYSDYTAHQLDPHCDDDRLLLSALHHAEEHPEIQTSVLTRDVGFRAKAKVRQIQAPKPLDEWELPSTPDPEKKELEKLRAQIATLPKLAVMFSNGQAHITPRQPAPPPSDASFVRQCVRKIQDKFPLHDSVANPIMMMNEGAMRERNKLVREFYVKYEHFVEQWLEFHQYLSRMVPVNLVLQNDGKRPATDIKVSLQFMEGLKILTTFPEEPQPPAEPPALEMVGVLGLRYSTHDMLARSPEIVRSVLLDPLALQFIRRSKNCLEISVPKVQHSSAVELPPLFAYFDDYNNMSSFNIECQIIADETQQESSPLLQVNVTKGGESAHWRIPYVNA